MPNSRGASGGMEDAAIAAVWWQTWHEEAGLLANLLARWTTDQYGYCPADYNLAMCLKVRLLEDWQLDTPECKQAVIDVGGVVALVVALAAAMGMAALMIVAFCRRCVQLYAAFAHVTNISGQRRGQLAVMLVTWVMVMDGWARVALSAIVMAWFVTVCTAFGLVGLLCQRVPEFDARRLGTAIILLVMMLQTWVFFVTLVNGWVVVAIVAAMGLDATDAALRYGSLGALWRLVVAVVVAAAMGHSADAKLQRFGCRLLYNEYHRLFGYLTIYRSAFVKTGGVTVVVAAMRQHTADAEVQRCGCGALVFLMSDDAACKQAIVNCGGLAAAVVAAMRQHTMDVGVECDGCAVLRELSCWNAASKQACVDAGGVAALLARMGRCTPAGRCIQHPEATRFADALHHIAMTYPTAVLEEVARTKTDCSSWHGLQEELRREALRRCASAQLQLAEEGAVVPALRHAITLAAAVQVDPAAIERALGRVREIIPLTMRDVDNYVRDHGLPPRPRPSPQERLESYGLGSLEPPNEFFCPITLDRMRDPVVASDGHTYERSAILTVLRNGNGLSPLTRKPLQVTIYPNLALKRRMQDHEEDMLRVAATAVANASDE